MSHFESDVEMATCGIAGTGLAGHDGWHRLQLSRDDRMQDFEFTSTPFDVQRGILFKQGRVYQDRDRQVAEFERAIGTKLPSDFLALIGDHCAGGFDGHYQVFAQDGVEVNWNHLLTMKLADSHDVPEHGVIRILREKSAIFRDDHGLALLPFGQAGVIGNQELRQSYLAFDLRDGGSVVSYCWRAFAPAQQL